VHHADADAETDPPDGPFAHRRDPRRVPHQGCGAVRRAGSLPLHGRAQEESGQSLVRQVHGRELRPQPGQQAQALDQASTPERIRPDRHMLIGLFPHF